MSPGDEGNNLVVCFPKDVDVEFLERRLAAREDLSNRGEGANYPTLAIAARSYTGIGDYFTFKIFLEYVEALLTEVSPEYYGCIPASVRTTRVKTERVYQFQVDAYLLIDTSAERARSIWISFGKTHCVRIRTQKDLARLVRDMLTRAEQARLSPQSLPHILEFKENVCLAAKLSAASARCILGYGDYTDNLRTHLFRFLVVEEDGKCSIKEMSEFYLYRIVVSSFKRPVSVSRDIYDGVERNRWRLRRFARQMLKRLKGKEEVCVLLNTNGEEFVFVRASAYADAMRGKPSFD